MPLESLYLGGERRIPGLKWLQSGKVRDIYEIDARRLLFVTSDRVSAFDVVMNEGIPHKGEVLTSIAAWWFENTRDVIENHLLSTDVDDVPNLSEEWKRVLRGRVMLVERCQPTTVEWVVRGYLAGSGHKEYQRSRSICGVALPEGLELSSRLPQPILTPTTKDKDHDLPLTQAQARERVGKEVYERAARASLDLFERGTKVLEKLGVILADTKFEFGLAGDRLLLIDEALTPDSSRFWPKERWKPGTNPPSYDKQILRDWLEASGWNKRPPPPTLSREVIERTLSGYLHFAKLLTGKDLPGLSR